MSCFNDSLYDSLNLPKNSMTQLTFFICLSFREKIMAGKMNISQLCNRFKIEKQFCGKNFGFISSFEKCINFIFYRQGWVSQGNIWIISFHLSCTSNCFWIRNKLYQWQWTENNITSVNCDTVCFALVLMVFRLSGKRRKPGKWISLEDNCCVCKIIEKEQIEIVCNLFKHIFYLFKLIKFMNNLLKLIHD